LQSTASTASTASTGTLPTPFLGNVGTVSYIARLVNRCVTPWASTRNLVPQLYSRQSRLGTLGTCRCLLPVNIVRYVHSFQALGSRYRSGTKKGGARWGPIRNDAAAAGTAGLAQWHMESSVDGFDPDRSRLSQQPVRQLAPLEPPQAALTTPLLFLLGFNANCCKLLRLVSLPAPPGYCLPFSIEPALSR
jgi:hypothetical protein